MSIKEKFQVNLISKSHKTKEYKSTFEAGENLSFILQTIIGMFKETDVAQNISIEI